MNVATVDTNKKMGIKIAAWAWTLLDSMGMLAAIIAFINLDGIEKALVFIVSMTFFGYRIYHLHLDAGRKKEENEKLKIENQILRNKLSKH